MKVLGSVDQTRRSFWNKPPEILVFGSLSTILGILLVIAAVTVGSTPSTSPNANLWPLVAWLAVGIAISGAGFAAGKSWGYIGSVVLYALAYASAIAQAIQREFVWGIFLHPFILVFLLVPRVRSYFFSKPQPQLSSLQHDATPVQPSAIRIPRQSLKSRLSDTVSRPSNIVTGIIMLLLILILPVVATSVHTVSVTEVRLNIIYPASAANNWLWFGFSGQPIGRYMFTWGGGKMALIFSLSNLGLLQDHTIESFRILTSGFTLYSSGVPVTLPNLATITFHMILQAPDYDYNGPVVLEMQTS